MDSQIDRLTDRQTESMLDWDWSNDPPPPPLALYNTGQIIFFVYSCVKMYREQGHDNFDDTLKNKGCKP